jgi:hypothetical protein
MELEGLSEENVVWFYREELKMIDRGSSSKIVPVTARRRLIRPGILEHGRGIDKTSGLVLTPKGRTLRQRASRKPLTSVVGLCQGSGGRRGLRSHELGYHHHGYPSCGHMASGIGDHRRHPRYVDPKGRLRGELWRRAEE